MWHDRYVNLGRCELHSRFAAFVQKRIISHPPEKILPVLELVRVFPLLLRARIFPIH